MNARRRRYRRLVAAPELDRRPVPNERKRKPTIEMQFTRTLIFFFVLLLLAGCAQRNNAVISKGPFQKRKYQPGWHVELFRKPMAKPAEQAEARRDTPDVHAQEMEEALSSRSNTASGQAPDPVEFEASASLTTTHPPVRPGSSKTFEPQVESAPQQAPRQENQMPRKRLQPLAIPAALFVGAGITLAFVTNSGLLVAGALLIGLVLAAVSLRRIRSHERSGKGFALVALVLGTLAALLTAMVIVRTGF